MRSLPSLAGVSFNIGLLYMRHFILSEPCMSNDRSEDIQVDIIKVFRFQRKTLLFLLGFFFPIIIFFVLPFLFRGFLENASIDFHEIFTHDTL